MTDDNQHPATLAFNEALASAFESGDFQAVGKAFVEDAVVLSPRGRPIRGRDAISMFWNGFSNRSGGISFVTGEMKAIGATMIRETGTVALTPRNATGQPANGKFLFLWLKEGDAWLLESAMWSRNNGEPAQQGGRARQGGGAQGAYRQGGQGGGGQGGGGQGGGGQGGRGGYRQGGNRQGGYQQQGGYGRNRGGIGGQAGGIGGQAGGIGGGGAGVGGLGGQQRRGGQRGQAGQRGQGGQAGQGHGSQNLYDQHLGLYSNRDD